MLKRYETRFSASSQILLTLPVAVYPFPILASACGLVSQA
jgi:hypothetical protein